MFARFGRPTWRHVGHFFLQNEVSNLAGSPLLVGSMFFFCFLAVLAPSWRDSGSIFGRLGLDFGRFWLYFGRFWALFCRLLVTSLAYDYSWKIYGSSWKTYPFSVGSYWKTCSFVLFCWRLVLDGLVGLREAQRIRVVSKYFIVKTKTWMPLPKS